jgi:hypothetical protein
MRALSELSSLWLSSCACPYYANPHPRVTDMPFYANPQVRGICLDGPKSGPLQGSPYGGLGCDLHVGLGSTPSLIVLMSYIGASE